MQKIKEHEAFLGAIHDQELLDVTYNTIKYDGIVTQTLTPFDYGPWNRHCSGELRYHFFSSDTGEGHPVPLKAEQIIKIKKIGKKFDPANIVRWIPKWHICRDWGIYS